MNYENFNSTNYSVQNTTNPENTENDKTTSENQGENGFQYFETSTTGEISSHIIKIDKNLEYNNAISFILLCIIALTLFIKIIINTFKDFQ